MDDLDRVGAAVERIAGAMEGLLFWVKVVVLAGLAYLILIILIAVLAGVGGLLSGGSLNF